MCATVRREFVQSCLRVSHSKVWGKINSVFFSPFHSLTHTQTHTDTHTHTRAPVQSFWVIAEISDSTEYSPVLCQNELGSLTAIWPFLFRMSEELVGFSLCVCVVVCVGVCVV